MPNGRLHPSREFGSELTNDNIFQAHFCTNKNDAKQLITMVPIENIKVNCTSNEFKG